MSPVSFRSIDFSPHWDAGERCAGFFEIVKVSGNMISKEEQEKRGKTRNSSKAADGPQYLNPQKQEWRKRCSAPGRYGIMRPSQAIDRAFGRGSRNFLVSMPANAMPSCCPRRQVLGETALLYA